MDSSPAWLTSIRDRERLQPDLNIWADPLLFRPSCPAWALGRSVLSVPGTVRSGWVPQARL
jgi:hypothetical protein